MNENIEFLQAFLKNPGKVGSIAPSSPELAKRMISGLKPDKDNIVLELGVGTGAITKFLQQIVPCNKSYLGIELDADLIPSVKENLPEMNIIHGSACETVAIHQESGLGHVGYIICCLPFVSLPRAVSDEIMEQIDLVMQKGCTFRSFQYAHGYYLPPARKFRKFMSERYGKIDRSPLVIKNVPPAYTLTWTTNR